MKDTKQDSFNPIHSANMSTPRSKRNKESETPLSMGADLKNMDELLQRLAQTNRQGVCTLASCRSDQLHLRSPSRGLHHGCSARLGSQFISCASTSASRPGMGAICSVQQRPRVPVQRPGVSTTNRELASTSCLNLMYFVSIYGRDRPLFTHTSCSVHKLVCTTAPVSVSVRVSNHVLTLTDSSRLIVDIELFHHAVRRGVHLGLSAWS